jgi:RNA polymerase sigma factor (sigma-70 family)
MDQDPDGSRLQLDRQRDGDLVRRWRAGDERAFGELYDAWYDRVHDLATRLVRDSARAADVTQDAFLAAWQRIDSLDDPAAFGGWLLRICRNRALNVLEKEGRSTTVDDLTFRSIEAEGSPVSAPDGFRVAGVLADHDDPAHAVGDQEVADLLWAAADALGERDRTVLDLQLRHGLTPAEIGEVVGVNRNAANQLVHRVKQRLEGAVTARLLWRGDAPSCPRLLADLDALGTSAFDQRAVTVANRHAESCEECGDRQRIGLQPAALFGAMPIVVAPILLKQQTAAALESAGVAITGSAHAPAATPGGGAPSSDAAGKARGEGPSGGSRGGSGGVASGATGTASASGAGLDAGTASAETAPARAASSAPTERRDTRRRALAIAAVLALLAVTGGVVLAVTGDDDPTPVATESPGTSDDLAAGDPTSAPSTAPATEAGVGTAADVIGHPTTTTTALAGPTTTAGPSIVPPPPPPPTTTTTPPGPTTTTTDPPPPPATASATMAPTHAPLTFVLGSFEQPVLTWSTSGGASVTVLGPGVSDTRRAGSVDVCPGTVVSGTVCTTPAGTYTYRVRVFAGDGDVLASDTVALTIP